MSATMSTLWYVDAPDPAAVLHEFSPDRDAAQALLSRLFPDLQVDPGGRVPLTEAGDTGKDDGVERFWIGSYPGVTVVSSRRFALRHPSELPAMWLRTPAAERTCLLASDPAGAWGSFAVWECGTLRRSFGANTVEFFEDQGLPFVWERPFWAGEHPLRWPPNVPPPPESLPFHPPQARRGGPRGLARVPLRRAPRRRTRPARHRDVEFHAAHPRPADLRPRTEDLLVAATRGALTRHRTPIPTGAVIPLLRQLLSARRYRRV